MYFSRGKSAAERFFEHGASRIVRELEESSCMFSGGVENYPKQKDLYKAYYNLGMAYECIIEYEKAMTAFSLANELHQDARFQSEIEYCERSSRCLEWRENGKR